MARTLALAHDPRMDAKEEKHIPLLKRPLKVGQEPLVGLTPPAALRATAPVSDSPVRERGGPEGAEPTRFGDWERKGRCSDF